MHGFCIMFSCPRPSPMCRAFTPSPESTYGKKGLPPKFPANASFFFVVPCSTGFDGGVIKAVLREGSGWKRPKPGHEVKISMEVTKGVATVDYRVFRLSRTLSGLCGPKSFIY